MDARVGERARQTIRSIAAAAGVSRQTVSNAINRPERVAPATLERVLAVIRELGYQPNEVARSLAYRSSRLIGFHVGDGSRNDASVLDPFLRELARIGESVGYRMVLSYSPEDDGPQIEGYERLLARSAVDGFVIANTHVSDRRPGWLRERAVPFVAFGRPWGDLSADHAWVDVDAAAGVRLAIDHLVELGHRRIGFVAGPADYGIADDRVAGWRAGLAANGLESDSLLARSRTLHPTVTGEVRRVLGSGVTALVCWDDLYAAASVHAIEANGKVPGLDVSVVSCDDSALTRHLRPRLTGLAQPLTDIATLVWRSLLSQLGDAPPTPPMHRLLVPTLMVRESTCQAP